MIDNIRNNASMDMVEVTNFYIFFFCISLTLTLSEMSLCVVPVCLKKFTSISLSLQCKHGHITPHFYSVGWWATLLWMTYTFRSNSTNWISNADSIINYTSVLQFVITTGKYILLNYCLSYVCRSIDSSNGSELSSSSLTKFKKILQKV